METITKVFLWIWHFLPTFFIVLVGILSALSGVWQNKFGLWEETHPKIMTTLGYVMAFILFCAAISDFQQRKNQLNKDDLKPLVTQLQLRDDLKPLVTQENLRMEIDRVTIENKNILKKLPTVEEIERVISIGKRIIIDPKDISFFINGKRVSHYENEKLVIDPVELNFESSTTITVNVHNYTGRTFYTPILTFDIANCTATSSGWQKNDATGDTSGLALIGRDFMVSPIRRGDPGVNFTPIDLVCDSEFDGYHGLLSISANEVTREATKFVILKKKFSKE